ncbi:hypothetical protein SLEP1_g8607 [Rubroshorea leprosula]|uniref:Pentatricopeptide repeat-containing protein n=1 Tax=Rubroshorea leprosula TaxID=152421 RepID=A0AAV5I7V1_9ROSI|nr:hypothetical protein SLEP1_g8607 [Rubroshorea leprosula]
MKRLFLRKQSIGILIADKLYLQSLRASVSSHSPLLTDQIYSLFIKSGHSLHPFLSTALISHFSRLGDFSRAVPFLFDTPNPDTVTFNALISGFARFRQPGHVFWLFDELRLSGLRPDVFTSSSLVKGSESFEENGVAHGVCLRLGFGYGAFVVSGLIENYAKSGDLESAEKCFDECLDVDHVVCTSMICGYVWNEEFVKAKEVFMKMRHLGLELNELSLTGVIGALFDLREGEQIHGLGVKMGLLCGCSIHLNNAVMSMYSRCGSKADALKMFDEIAEPDIVSWTERIGAAYDVMVALESFNCLRCTGLEANEYTMINSLSKIEGEEMLKSGKQIQAVCHKEGLLQVISVSNALISMYAKCGQMKDVRCVFEDMIDWDSVSWNSIISGYSDHGLVCETFEMFSKMRDFSAIPNNYTIASILEAVSDSNSLELAMQIHSYMIKCGFMLDNSTMSLLVTSYARCSGIDESKSVFSEISKINSVPLNAMASAFVHASCYADALDLFCSARNSNLEIDAATFTIALKACAAISDVEQARAIQSLAIKLGFHQDCFVETAVIDVYCKCGCMVDAEKAFTYASRNLAAWNAMITGYAQHGCYNGVFDLYNKMTEYEIEPDEITYLGVLTSCCHAGLLQEAQNYIYCMIDLHGLTPHLEHYACIIDLLGRAGLVEDAKRTIDQMPIQPDAHLWQILLSACSIYGNVDIGRVAASKLLELQPNNESAYVLLSNLCASAGMWNDVRQLRSEMKEKQICKEPGSSWIQIRGAMHCFFAHDRSHPDMKHIYMALAKVYKEMQASQEMEKDGTL